MAFARVAATPVVALGLLRAHTAGAGVRQANITSSVTIQQQEVIAGQVPLRRILDPGRRSSATRMALPGAVVPF